MVNPTNNFNKYVHQPNDDKNCGYCLDQIDNTKLAVAHGGEGTKHPIHLDCFREYIESKENTVNCMHCQRAFDIKDIKNQLNEIEHPFAKKVASAAAGVLGGIVGGFVFKHFMQPLSLIEPNLLKGDLDREVASSHALFITIITTCLSTAPDYKHGTPKMPSLSSIMNYTLMLTGGSYALGNIAENDELILGSQIAFGSITLALGTAKAADMLYKRYMN